MNPQTKFTLELILPIEPIEAGGTLKIFKPWKYSILKFMYNKFKFNCIETEWEINFPGWGWVGGWGWVLDYLKLRPTQLNFKCNCQLELSLAKRFKINFTKEHLRAKCVHLLHLIIWPLKCKQFLFSDNKSNLFIKRKINISSSIC